MKVRQECERERWTNNREGQMNILPELVRESADPLTGVFCDYDSLLLSIGDAEVVLLGEASHGTHEFYKERAQITKRLIEEKEFNAVGIEGDWPDAYEVNRYVRGCGEAVDAVEALSGFKRFPAWMWRNADVLDFVGWLRTHNDNLQPAAEKTGFYGLDLYSLHSSMRAVLGYLERVDPASARRARERYACFERFGKDTQSYGLATGLGIALGCEKEVVNELLELRLRQGLYLQRDGRPAADEFFCAEQNAIVVKEAEEYYRQMFHGEVSSWNLRDQHMFETLQALKQHLQGQGVKPRIAVWAHNSHVGDARATQMNQRGELNLGQLVRQAWPDKSYLLGFTTHSGTVTAASEWDAPAERKTVRPALSDSYEAIFHKTAYKRFFLNLRGTSGAAKTLRARKLERAIGVIYRPETERQSHYFECCLPGQFDGVLHFDQTRAVEPLEPTSEWNAGELEETFPSGL
jgi:erythromycin esterase-like protein